MIMIGGGRLSSGLSITASALLLHPASVDKYIILRSDMLFDVSRYGTVNPTRVF